MSGLVGNSRRHILSCRGSCVEIVCIYEEFCMKIFVVVADTEE